mmetsp:Transcript_13181/g.30755  ORF Transcript_13181/g.30755 Transcript_13181/m.30755 type:complete len:326 (+) Transcript_13181:214-1191(+)|eukprot:CAMPEP_0172383786 /NCGR_PEP_ID=MMETSP1061-20121228/1595_1 /TAXON_ID=37318 /ORGANISM="Pseudo-nitzschia pungens, Strain cf. pungens" /LENGTH=325 /DNA_ID=CAMNT_0013112127 /DNA_START=106 /DNA_END=1083 /DNA_ORIENTATION=+
MTTKYPNIVVTTIKCDVFDDGKVVHFTNDTSPGKKARFLINVEQIPGDRFGETKFKADVLITNAEIEAKIAEFGTRCTPLFYLHGYFNPPSQVFADLEKACKKFKDNGCIYYPIPVLWPTQGGIRYLSDQDGFSQEAGQLLKLLTDIIPNDLFERKSLMMHSMGNHVVFNGACGAGQPDVEFENIFMVAADVPFDIFHKDPYEDYKFRGRFNGNKELKADRFVKMLAKNSDGSYLGKIYVLHTKRDTVLRFSNIANFENRIGFRGIGARRDKNWSFDSSIIRDNIKNVYENKDGANELLSDPLGHGFQFDDWAIKFYSEKSIKKN